MEAKEKSTLLGDRSLGRREFLAGSAAALGIVAATGLGCSPSENLEEGGDEVLTPPEEQVYQGLCRGNCGGGCRMNVHVRDGKVVKTSPIKEENPMDELICPRGLSHAQRIYAPERLQYPMRRVEGTPRGGGEWERLTWDEAVAYIAEKWQGYIAEFGSTSIGYSFGAGTYANNYYVYQRLFNLIGGTKYAQEYDMCALNYGWRIFGMSMYLIGNPKQDEANAKTIFIWASNATIGSMPRWKYIREAMKNGARVIDIDPIYTDAAAKSTKWVPIKQGTDGALAMAMCKHIIDNGMADDAFMTKLSVAPFLVREDNGKFLRLIDLGIEGEAESGASDSNAAWGGGMGGEAASSPVVVMGADGNWGDVATVAEPVIRGSFEVEGIKVSTAYELFVERIAEWTTEKASEVTGIPAETIVEVAEAYCDGPTTLHLGFGNDHWGNAGSITHAQFMLPIVTGQMGKPGAGVQGSNGGATTGFAGENWMTIYHPETIYTLPALLLDLPDIMEQQSYSGVPISPKSMFFYACNPLASHCDRNAIKGALDKFDLIITADTVMNDTTNYSDVVLPVPHWYEYETYRTCPSEYVDFQDKCIEPQFECKPDVEIACLIGKAMGYAAMDFDNDTFHSEFLDTETSAAYGISWAALKEQKHMFFGVENYLYGNEYIPFVTTSGRAEFYLEDVAPGFDATEPLDTRLLALPFYEEPIEAYESNPLREKYPITIMTHRVKFKVHTAFAKCPWFIELQPEPTVQMNPEDAAARGIADGDYVRLYNDRGEVVMRAWLDAGMRPGVTWTEHTWLEDQYVAGAYSSLTSRATRHYHPTNHPFDTLCEIEKYEKEA